MIFVGDIALPHKTAIDFSDFPKEFYSKTWFGNLEGAIVDNDDNSITGVYNQKDAIKDLISKFDFRAFALANNHIFDTGSLGKTLNFLDDNNISYCGIGKSLEKANRPLILEENGEKIIVLNFGWEVIQCAITEGDYPGVNPLRKSHVLETVQNVISDYPNAKVIPFMHWSYELEAEPQPFERELAKVLIDMGVFGVIGTHPHRIGGFEEYKGKPIIYSLGNWLFKQNHYYNNNLKFPNFCNHQLALEWNFKNNDLKFHFFNYDKEKATLNYLHTEEKDSVKMKLLTPFENLSDKEYKDWYKKYHYHKNKGLPIYNWSDPVWLITKKNQFVLLRDKLIKILLNKGK